MISTLLGHQWKAFWRARSAGKNLAIQVFIAFITIYFLLVAIGIGFFLVELISNLFPGQEPIKVFCGFILYYFSFDVITRFMIQELPTLTVQPYLLQNVRRRQLVGFLNFRSLFTPLNILPLLIFLPFTFLIIEKNYGSMAATGLTVCIIFLTITNHFLITFLKRKTVLSSWWMVGFFLVVAALLTADYFRFFSLSGLSQLIFIKVLQIPVLALVTILMAAAAFINNYRFLLNNLYLDDLSRKEKRKQSSSYAFLNRFGTIGELVALDIKLMLRNKRPRSILMLSFIFIFYGLIFYKRNYIDGGNWGLLMFGGVFLTGIFISNYGQFLFAWQSRHFDGLMSGHLQVKAYIKSKFVLFTGMSTIIFVLISFYGLISWKILVVQLAGYLFNIGIHTVIAVYYATRTYKAVDLSKGGAFNLQGLGASQWIYSLMIFIIPLVIYLPLALLVDPIVGVIALGTCGLVSFLLLDWWTEVLTKEFMKRKHMILEGFREK